MREGRGSGARDLGGAKGVSGAGAPRVLPRLSAGAVLSQKRESTTQPKMYLVVVWVRLFSIKAQGWGDGDGLGVRSK